jgi:SAM-dependent methyltransferase
MSLKEEHQRSRDFWNKRISERSQAPSQFRYQSDFFERYKDQLREPILDVGCGDGEFLEFLIERGMKQVHGIDISDVAVRLARERLRKYLGDEVNERIKVGDMAYLSSYFALDSFNAIICEGTFHQTTYCGARTTAIEMSKVISTGGLVYVSVRSDSTPPKNADSIVGEKETYRLKDEGDIARCYFSEQGIVELFKERFDIIELEEKELITRIGKEQYKMRIMVMRKE